MGLKDSFTQIGHKLTGWGYKQHLKNDPRLQALRVHCTALNIKEIMARPIEETRFVVIDTETTGFGVYAGDEIISIAMLEMKGTTLTDNKFSSLVNPHRDIPETSTTIHGLTDADVQDAPDINTLISQVADFIGDAVIVGHHVGFDVRFLDKTLHRLTGCRFRNPRLCTMRLYLGHSGRMGQYSLEQVAEFCEVPITDRHTAHGDALATAHVFAALVDKVAQPTHPVARLMSEQNSEAQDSFTGV